MLLLVTFRRGLSDLRVRQCYKILKVSRVAKPDRIKQQFLELSKTHHPDNLKTGGHGKFLKLKEAYDMIKDAPLRYAGPVVQPLGNLHKPTKNYHDNSDQDDDDHEWQKQDLSHRNFTNDGTIHTSCEHSSEAVNLYRTRPSLSIMSLFIRKFLLPRIKHRQDCDTPPVSSSRTSKS